MEKLISEVDFNKISVETIMKEAGVSRSTFYRYFKDKYDVMNANFKNILDYFEKGDTFVLNDTKVFPHPFSTDMV